MIRVEPRNASSRFFKFGVPLVSAVLSLCLAAIPLAFAGADIALAYQFMIKGVFGSVFSFSEMLTRATPLIFTGLAATIAFRARLWNRRHCLCAPAHAGIIGVRLGPGFWSRPN